MTHPRRSAADLVYWDDFTIGDAYDVGQFRIDPGQAAVFSTRFHGPTGDTTTVSPMYLTARLMRAIVDGYLKGAAGLGAGGVPDVKWLAPVQPGTALSAQMTCVAKRPLNSRPGVGLVELIYEVLELDHGAPVLSWRSNQFLRQRPAAPVPPHAAGAQKQSPAPAPATNDQPPQSQPSTAKPHEASRSTPKEPSATPPAGAIWLGSHRFARAPVIAFAELYDPQDFHLDDNAAQQSLFGALCASGWQTCAVCHRLVHDHLARERTFAISHTARPPQRMTGLRDIKWRRPVYVGEQIDFSCTPLDCGDLHCFGQRPGGGLVFEMTAALAD